MMVLMCCIRKNKVKYYLSNINIEILIQHDFAQTIINIK